MPQPQPTPPPARRSTSQMPSRAQASSTSLTAPTTTSSSSNARRQTIGKYELGKVLAVGDFDCWTRLCTHVVTGAEYVVRTYRKEVLREVQWMWDRVHDSIHVQRFLPKHEGIVEMVECFETKTAVYILMQLFPSINATKLYTTRHLQTIAPFLAERFRQTPGAGAAAVGPGPLPEYAPIPRHPALEGALDKDSSASASASAESGALTASGSRSGGARELVPRRKHKTTGARHQRTSASPPANGRLTMRTPPLEQLDIRYTSPPPSIRLPSAASAASAGPGFSSSAHNVPKTISPLSIDGLMYTPSLTSLGDAEDDARRAAGRRPHRVDSSDSDQGSERDDDSMDDDEADDDDDSNSNSKGESGARGRRPSKVPLDATRHVFIQVVRAVQHMHQHAVVHLGLAPDHIMMNERGVAKVGNLISCRACVPGEMLRELRGTRHTVAPEVLRGEAYDPFLADSWSLGVVLYFMLNEGRYPHDGANTLQHILYQHVRAPNPSIPPTAKDLLSRLLQMNPVNRLSVDAILMHPFCVGTWQEMEEEAHLKTENSTNPSAAVSAAAAAAAVANNNNNTAHSEKPFSSFSAEADRARSAEDHDGLTDGAEPAQKGSAATPTIATAPLVIASARLLSAGRRRLSFLDERPAEAAGAGAGGGGVSAFARARGVFLRAPGASGHVWGQGQGEYGMDVGAGAGLAFDVQHVTPATAAGATGTGTGTGATAPYGGAGAGGGPSLTSPSSVQPAVVVARVSGPMAMRHAGGPTSTWAVTQQQRIKAINAAALLGGRASVVQSYWDPVQEAFSMDIPPGLTRENEAAYVIQHTYRAYLQRRRFRRATRRLNRIGWRLFESLYTSPPPPPPAEEEEDGRASGQYDFLASGRPPWHGPPRRLSRGRGGTRGQSGSGSVFRSRSFMRGPGRASREGLSGSSPASSQRADQGLPSPSVYGTRSRADEEEEDEIVGGMPNRRPLRRGGSATATMAGRAGLSASAATGASGGGGGGGGGSGQNLNHYEVFSIDSSTPMSSKPASRSGSLARLVPPSPGSMPRRATLMPGVSAAKGGGGGGGGGYDMDDGRRRESERGYYDSYRGGGHSRAAPTRAGSRAATSGPALPWADSFRGESSSQLYNASGLPVLHGAAGSATSVPAAAMRASDRETHLPVVTARDDCPVCHRPPPLTKKIHTTPYALTNYEYKSGEFVRTAK